MDANLQRRVQRYGWDKAAPCYDRSWRANVEPRVSMAMSGMRMSIKVGADDAPERTLREIVAWGATQSTVSATLQEARTLPIDVTLI